MSIHGLLFQWASTIKIQQGGWSNKYKVDIIISSNVTYFLHEKNVHLALNNNHSLNEEEGLVGYI
jgi:hypothetical protein